MSPISIKIAQYDDAAQVAPLFNAYRQFYEQENNLALATEFIKARLKNNESIIFIAEDDMKNAVGFCQIYPSFCSVIAEPIYVLYDLFVADYARKSGTGKMLLEYAHAHAQKHQIARMDLTTAKNNFTAQSLYESLGWIKNTHYYTYNKNV